MELTQCPEQGLAKPGGTGGVDRPVKGPSVGRAPRPWGQEHRTALDTMRTGAPERGRQAPGLLPPVCHLHLISGPPGGTHREVSPHCLIPPPWESPTDSISSQKLQPHPIQN